MTGEAAREPAQVGPAREDAADRLGADTDADADADMSYRAFCKAVAAAQLAQWLPENPALVLDLSGASCPAGRQARDLGHYVVQALRPGERSSAGVHGVIADPLDVTWCAPQSVDVVLAEHGSLSASLATEVTVSQLARVLRPGGHLWMCVQSLLSGCAALAGEGRWAELSDVPAADVVLVPTSDGGFTRCFSPEDVHALLADAGFIVDWVRPRTVLSAEQVEALLQAQPGSLASVVRAEVSLADAQRDPAVGSRLLVAAHLPPG